MLVFSVIEEVERPEIRNLRAVGKLPGFQVRRPPHLGRPALPRFEPPPHEHHHDKDVTVRHGIYYASMVNSRKIDDQLATLVWRWLLTRVPGPPRGGV